MDRVAAVVIGAGVVGLACARALAARGRPVLVLEAADAFGSVNSARNSEVMHAGLYYAPGSLKARLCLSGRRMLQAYAEARAIAHRRCGKLVVAPADGQRPELEAIAVRARACGVDDLVALDRADLLRDEPALQAVAALWSPSTGIIDSHALMLALLADAERDGAMLALRCPVQRIECGSGPHVVHVGGADPVRIGADLVVNSAGLQAQALARTIDGLDPVHVPRPYWARGHYFALQGRVPFRHLIYPVPEEGGLGVHLTLDLAGQARFGPDVQWIESVALGAEDFSVDPARGAAFEASVRRWWPGLPAGRLQPAYAGIRPKLSGPGEPAADFVIQGPRIHGVRGLVNLFGIESPGLTASLALAQDAVDALELA